MRWSIVLVLILQNLHLGSAPLWRILAWKFLVKRPWSCAATTNLSASNLSLALLSHWWVSCKSTPAFWFQRGYWSCKDFDFLAVSIAFFPFSLVILFNFAAFSMFFISPSNSVSRSKSISCANSLASLTTESEPFFFPVLKLVAASSHLINSSTKRDQLLMFYKTAQVESNLSPCYFLGGKGGEYHPLGDACCVLSSSF